MSLMVQSLLCMLALHLLRASSMARWVLICLGIFLSRPGLRVIIFLVSHGVGTRRGSEQEGARLELAKKLWEWCEEQVKDI
jgi:hypothetical protein